MTSLTGSMERCVAVEVNLRVLFVCSLGKIATLHSNNSFSSYVCNKDFINVGLFCVGNSDKSIALIGFGFPIKPI